MSTYTIRSILDRERLIQALSLLNLERDWDVTIARHKTGRSLSQNSLYWKWLKIVGDELGYAAQEVHETLMPRFLAPKLVTIGGFEREVYSTRGLDTAAFSEYLDHIYRFAVGELGIILPLPEELHERTS
jgi:hypothetical protein